MKRYTVLQEKYEEGIKLMNSGLTMKDAALLVGLPKDSIYHYQKRKAMKAKYAHIPSIGEKCVL